MARLSKKRGGFIEETVVVAELRAHDAGLERAGVAQAGATAELGDLGIVNGYDFLKRGEVVRHCASSSARSRFFSTLAR